MMRIMDTLDYVIPEYNSVTLESNEEVEFNETVYGGFYISYNNLDTDLYGCVTTALVLGHLY